MSDIIVAFHIGRGGRSHNPGHKSFIGEKSIGEFTEDLFTRFEHQDKFHNRLGWDESFGGVKCIIDCLTDEDFETLETYYGISRDDLGELEYYCGASGNSVGLTQTDVASGVGVINIDYDYDTTYAKYLSDCDKDELELIRKYTGWKSNELKEYISTFIIQDWAGNRMFPEETFETYEDAWEFIYDNVDNSEYDKTGDENDNVYQDIYVNNTAEK